MTTINLTTAINCNIEKCFDYARSIDVHKLSVNHTKEKVVSGKTSGLCEVGDKITWQAVHFGIRQKLSVEITKVESPYFFEDRMTKGAFKSMCHKHYFKIDNGTTIMIDEFQYEVPLGSIGQLFDKIILKSYMTRFLETRNNNLKKMLENNV